VLSNGSSAILWGRNEAWNRGGATVSGRGYRGTHPNGHGVYGRLQKRLDRFPSERAAEALYEILKRLYTEEERRSPPDADQADRLDGIARRTKKSPPN